MKKDYCHHHFGLIFNIHNYRDHTLLSFKGFNYKFIEATSSPEVLPTSLPEMPSLILSPLTPQVSPEYTQLFAQHFWIP